MATNPELQHWNTLCAAWLEANQAAIEARVMCALAGTGATAEQITGTDRKERLADALSCEIDRQVRSWLDGGP